MHPDHLTALRTLDSSSQSWYTREIALFISENSQRNISSRKLRKILNLLEEWWTVVDDFRCFLPFLNSVLCFIAERAFRSDILESEFVSKLLFYFSYQTDEDGEPTSVEFPSVFPPDCSCKFMRFFLGQANRERTTINGLRVVDWFGFHGTSWLRPGVACSRSPAMLQLLLQHGARFPDGIQDTQFPLLGVTLCVLNTMSQMHWLETTDQMALPKKQDQTLEEAMERFQDTARCARILLRASPQFPSRPVERVQFHSYYKHYLFFRGFPTPEAALRWLVRNGIPELEYRTTRPMSLKHACRLSVRKVLHENWLLPDGLDALPIPDVLKRFINLEDD